MRHNTFKLFFKMINELQERLGRKLVIVETGTIRKVEYAHGDGHSTLKFSDYVQQQGGSFYSIDNNKEAVSCSKKLVAEQLSEGPTSEHKNINVVEALSTEFLESFPDKIDVLYLDSANDEYIGLAEYEAAKPKLYDHTIILIDDCLENSPAQRKGLLSIPKMLEDGYIKVLHEYQCVLAKELL